MDLNFRYYSDDLGDFDITVDISENSFRIEQIWSLADNAEYLLSDFLAKEQEKIMAGAEALYYDRVGDYDWDQMRKERSYEI